MDVADPDAASGDPNSARMFPGANGGVEWSPLSTDPSHNMAFAINLHQPMTYTVRSAPPIRTASCGLAARSRSFRARSSFGNVTAVDYNNGKIAWQVKTPQPMIGGILATAGGLLFTGEANGWFKAYNTANGKVAVAVPGWRGRQCAAVVL